MAKYIHLVFSDPPPGTTEAEYNAWYDAHVQEILAVDGWVAATRYRLAPVINPQDTGGYRYLSLYELSLPPDEAIANLESAGLDTQDSYVQRKGESGADDPLPLTAWFDEIRFGSWNAIATSSRILPE